MTSLATLRQQIAFWQCNLSCTGYLLPILAFIILLFSPSPGSCKATSADMPTGVIDAFNNDVFVLLTNAPVYNKHLPPQESRPIRVNISIFLFGFGNIDEAKTEFNLHLLLRISWFDERLRPWNATVAKGKAVTILEGGSWHLDRLWTPALHVPNSKIPNILQDKTQNPVLTRIQSDGQILVSKRIILQGVSQMDFRLYPLDVQAIDFEIESNELSYDNLQLSWRSVMPYDASEHFVWNGFSMVRHELQTMQVNYTHTGTFSRIVATFYLSRIFGQFLLDVYVPIYLYVIISWGSFWIEITAAPARVTLCVTILLTMVTAARNAREKLPPVSYIHALDVFITVCIFFVFATIIEYTAVNYIFFREKRSLLKRNKRLKSMRKRQLYETKQQKQQQQQLNQGDNSNGGAPNIEIGRLKSGDGDDESSMSYNEKSNNSSYNHDCTLTSADDVNLTIASGDNFCTGKKCGDEGSSQESGSSNSSLSSGSSEDDLRSRGWLAKIGHYFSRLRRHIVDRKYRAKVVEGGEEIAYEIDRLSRIAFPSLFLLFNIVYWLVIVIASARVGHE